MLLSRSLKATVLGCALVAGACDRQSDDRAQQQADDAATAKPASGALDRSHKGEPIPDFTLSDAQGGQLRLPSLKGEPLLINLWATWCAPCVKELPTLNSIAGRSSGSVRVLTISQDSGDPEKVLSFLHDRGLVQLQALFDPKNDLSFHYGTGTLPTTVLYDAQGKELWRYVGGEDWTSPAAAQLLEEGTQSTPASTSPVKSSSR